VTSSRPINDQQSRFLSGEGSLELRETVLMNENSLIDEVPELIMELIVFSNGA